ncbi:aspartate aminotransferase family protein [Myxococcota bacterium]|nr:aspartate aminotransferase family protein [Myxococcota bacterium]
MDQILLAAPPVFCVYSLTHGVLRIKVTLRQEYLEAASEYLARLDNSYSYFPEDDTPVFVRGKGSRLYDPDGNEFLDMVAGYGALNQGHTHPKIVASLLAQADRLTHTSATLSDVKIEFAEKLASISPIPNTKVHFDLGGARAVEGAKLLTRAYTGKSKVISFHNSFHGRSTGSLSMYDADTFHHLFHSPRDYYSASYPYCYRCPAGLKKETCNYECLNGVYDILEENKDIGAIIVEPALGARGYIIPPKTFFKKLRRICDKYGLLLIDDEIQMGLGRLGSMFACEYYETVPDIILLSKSIAGGMWPLSAILASKDIMERIRPGTLGSTFAGAPLGCAVGIASIEVIEEEQLCRRSLEYGEYFMEELHKHLSEFPIIGNIDGIGLGIGIELILPNGEPATEEAQKLQLTALRNRLLLQRGGPAKNIINLIPALTITKAEIDEAVLRIRENLMLVLGEPEVIEHISSVKPVSI